MIYFFRKFSGSQCTGFRGKAFTSCSCKSHNVDLVLYIKILTPSTIAIVWLEWEWSEILRRGNMFLHSGMFKRLSLISFLDVQPTILILGPQYSFFSSFFLFSILTIVQLSKTSAFYRRYFSSTHHFNGLLWSRTCLGS